MAGVDRRGEKRLDLKLELLVRNFLSGRDVTGGSGLAAKVFRPLRLSRPTGVFAGVGVLRGRRFGSEHG